VTWDIDEAVRELEERGSTGTSITRILMDLQLIQKEGLVPTPHQLERGHGLVWGFAVGGISLPKLFAYGQTIHEAYLNAMKKLGDRDPREAGYDAHVLIKSDDA